ncbi:MAG: hypothetical protein ACRYG4_12470 [Janthinobacterium lividum]
MRAIAEVESKVDLEWNWHHDLLVDRLMSLARGDIKRLLVCHGHSLVCRFRRQNRQASRIRRCAAEA